MYYVEGSELTYVTSEKNGCLDISRYEMYAFNKATRVLGIIKRTEGIYFRLSHIGCQYSSQEAD